MKKTPVLILIALSACNSNGPEAIMEIPADRMRGILGTLANIVFVLGLVGYGLNLYFGQEWNPDHPAYVRHYLFGGMITAGFALGILSAIIGWL
jgi:hypothetical protein